MGEEGRAGRARGFGGIGFGCFGVWGSGLGRGFSVGVEAEGLGAYRRCS